MYTVTRPSFSSDLCALKKVAGPCKKKYPRWYFNSKKGKCEKFNYGGCKGNNNRFATERQCREICATITGSVALGLLCSPNVPGCSCSSSWLWKWQLLCSFAPCLSLKDIVQLPESNAEMADIEHKLKTAELSNKKMQLKLWITEKDCSCRIKRQCTQAYSWQTKRGKGSEEGASWSVTEDVCMRNVNCMSKMTKTCIFHEKMNETFHTIVSTQLLMQLFFIQLCRGLSLEERSRTL